MEREGTPAVKFKFAYADPDFLVRQSDFYMKTGYDPSYTESVHKVCKWGLESNSPMATKAGVIAAEILSIAPSVSPCADMSSFVRENVISKLTHREKHSDVFWCVLLSCLDENSDPTFSLGGPFHRAVLTFHDDFHPQDVHIG